MATNIALLHDTSGRVMELVAVHGPPPLQYDAPGFGPNSVVVRRVFHRTAMTLDDGRTIIYVEAGWTSRPWGFRFTYPVWRLRGGSNDRSDTIGQSIDDYVTATAKRRLHVEWIQIDRLRALPSDLEDMCLFQASGHALTRVTR